MKEISDETIRDADRIDLKILTVEISDAALEIAAGAVGAIPTASIDIVPPNCC
jgi:hypothetical protein